MTINYQKASFLTSAAKLEQLPTDTGIEIAFAGRSNAGKSSALNALTRNKKLAFTSKTPGRTQLINVFSLDEARRLVDLPGYGYAKVSAAVKERWQLTLGQYLQERASLRGLILLTDIRHPLKASDKNLLHWASLKPLEVHMLLTKSDKLGRMAIAKALQECQQTVADLESKSKITYQAFSAHTGYGLDLLQEKMKEWFVIRV